MSGSEQMYITEIMLIMFHLRVNKHFYVLMLDQIMSSGLRNLQNEAEGRLKRLYLKRNLISSNKEEDITHSSYSTICRLNFILTHDKQ